MNFFGHALLAARRSDDPRFVLGSMLPDLVSMAGTRLSAVHDAQLAAGVALHHETDARFHAAEPFYELCRWASEELQSAGVHRATARAVGHVGSELLLDGLLSTDGHARAAYARALEPEVREPLAELLSLRGAMQPEELSTLMLRLAQAPLPEGYRDTSFVLERLKRILAPRPRLSFKPSDLEPTAAWLRKAQQTLHEQGTGWIDALL
jgi:hypothetical protein